MSYFKLHFEYSSIEALGNQFLNILTKAGWGRADGSGKFEDASCTQLQYCVFLNHLKEEHSGMNAQLS